MGRKQTIILWFAIGLSVVACFVLSLITYLSIGNSMSLAALVVTAIGVAVFWISFLIESVYHKK